LSNRVWRSATTPAGIGAGRNDTCTRSVSENGNRSTTVRSWAGVRTTTGTSKPNRERSPRSTVVRTAVALRCDDEQTTLPLAM